MNLSEFVKRSDPRRLQSETVPMTLHVPASGGEMAHHHLDVSLAYGADGRLREIVFVSRGKIGHGLDMLLHDLGIKLSRAIQGRDPDTGDDGELAREPTARPSPSERTRQP